MSTRTNTQKNTHDAKHHTTQMCESKERNKLALRTASPKRTVRVLSPKGCTKTVEWADTHTTHNHKHTKGIIRPTIRVCIRSEKRFRSFDRGFLSFWIPFGHLVLQLNNRSQSLVCPPDRICNVVEIFLVRYGFWLVLVFVC